MAAPLLPTAYRASKAKAHLSLESHPPKAALDLLIPTQGPTPPPPLLGSSTATTPP